MRISSAARTKLSCFATATKARRSSSDIIVHPDSINLAGYESRFRRLTQIEHPQSVRDECALTLQLCM